MKLVIITLVFMVSSHIFSQNIVQNSSFEDTLNCPTGPGQVYKCKGWESYLHTPDYFNTCDKLDEVGVPFNWEGYQNAFSKNSYMGLFTYYEAKSDTREVIGSELLENLQIGEKYYVSLYISRGDNSKYASNNIGVSFSTVSFVNNIKPLFQYNSLSHVSSVISDSMKWTNIRGSFIADSNYRYIMIGNFHPDSLTDTISIKQQAFSQAYYYIDDICVSKDSITCFHNVSIKNLKASLEIEVFPNPFTDYLILSSKNHLPKRIEIFNSSSQKKLQAYFTDTIRLDLEFLTVGIYYYLITDDFGLQYKGKIVKN